MLKDNNELKSGLVIFNIILVISSLFSIFTVGFNLILIISTILVCLIFNVFYIWLYLAIKNSKIKIKENRKNILLYRREYKEDIRNNSKVFLQIQNLKLFKKWNLILKLSKIISLTLLIVCWSIFLILFEYLDDNYKVILILLPLILFSIHVLLEFEYLDMLISIRLTSVVKTENRLIIIQAKNATNNTSNLALDYNVSTLFAPDSFDVFLTIGFFNKLKKKQLSNVYFEKEVVEDLSTEDGVRKIIETNNSKYYINIYEDVKMIRNKKNYYLLKGLLKYQNGTEEKKKFRVYKVYENIENLFLKDC